ncbi:unnamed protein product [Caenorhabditis auriculariae]|uniref:Uncharacterized protein n=1 Tax=Caenorhabditis auriculariae TaxID=2777116 RepID=A0A8S1GV84_9PELO|nr:unnamed protein product [Caenorhabditis auriculariae]
MIGLQHYDNLIRQLQEHQARVSSPIPEDPQQTFIPGYVRAATLSALHPHSHHREHRRRRHVPTVQRDWPPPVYEQLNAEGRPEEQPVAQAEGERPLSPTQLPGVTPLPLSFNSRFQDFLTPGKYYAKSFTRYIGPFDNIPRAADLPASDRFVIFQRMGRLPGNTRKIVFRQVGSVET